VGSEWGVGSGEWGRSFESENLRLPDFSAGCCLLNYSSDLTFNLVSPLPIPHSLLPIPDAFENDVGHLHTLAAGFVAQAGFAAMLQIHQRQSQI